MLGLSVHRFMAREFTDCRVDERDDLSTETCTFVHPNTLFLPHSECCTLEHAYTLSLPRNERCTFVIIYPRFLSHNETCNLVHICTLCQRLGILDESQRAKGDNILCIYQLFFDACGDANVDIRSLQVLINISWVCVHIASGNLNE